MERVGSLERWKIDITPVQDGSLDGYFARSNFFENFMNES